MGSLPASEYPWVEFQLHFNHCLSPSPARRPGGVHLTLPWGRFSAGAPRKGVSQVSLCSAPRASTKLIQVFLKQFCFVLQTLKFVFKFTYYKIYSFWYMILWVSINAEHHVTITQINVQKEHHRPKFSHIIPFQSPWCIILLMKKNGQAEVI